MSSYQHQFPRPAHSNDDKHMSERSDDKDCYGPRLLVCGYPFALPSPDAGVHGMHKSREQSGNTAENKGHKRDGRTEALSNKTELHDAALKLSPNARKTAASCAVVCLPETPQHETP